MSLLLKIAGLGLVCAAAGWIDYPDRFWASALLAGFYALTLSLGAMVFLAIQELVDSRWSRPFQRVSEALASGLWIGIALTALAVAFGGPSLYGWVHAPGGHAPHSQELWLSRPFQLLRLAAYAVAWLAFGGALLRAARRRRVGIDAGSGKGPAARLLVVFALTFTAASMDWIMALEPHWFSTIFGIYAFAGSFLSGIAAIGVMSAIERGTRGIDPEGLEESTHDLGKLLFAFSCFWAYIWFCQYLLIWYTNIPEETSFFIARTAGGWGFLTALSVGLNWVVPFFALMTRAAKSNPKTLLRVGICVLFGHWVDLFVLIMPRFIERGPDLSGWEVGLFAGAVALLGWVVEGKWERKEPEELCSD
ncbi:MAG: hypothetical protein HY549_10935 [Elusimicrobia bacterium]|nr:hypothetical protein [Elusimicrobiota bacterium]